MLQPRYTKQFEKDLKRVGKRGKLNDKLKYIIRKLINEESLEPRYKVENSGQFGHPFRVISDTEYGLIRTAIPVSFRTVLRSKPE